MASVQHTPASFKAIADDLREIATRVDALSDAMKLLGVEQVAVDGEKGQVTGRTALHGFCGSAEIALRKAKDRAYLAGLDDR